MANGFTSSLPRSHPLFSPFFWLLVTTSVTEHAAGTRKRKEGELKEELLHAYKEKTSTRAPHLHLHTMELEAASCKTTSPSSSIFLGTSEIDVPETSSSLVHTRKRWWRTTGGNMPRFFSGDAPGWRHHFLDTCFLCKKPIAAGEDVFMYRGDAPFCSEECRQEQMDMDEALEDELILSRSPAAPNHASPSLKRKPTMIFTPNDHLGAGTAVAVG